MKTLNYTLVLYALSIGLLATAAFANSTVQRHAHANGSISSPRAGYAYHRQRAHVYTPPPPDLLYAPQHGNAYAPVYVPGFGNMGSNGDSISGSGIHY